MNFIKKTTDSAKRQVIKHVINGLNSASDKNLARLLGVMNLITPKEYKELVNNIKKSLERQDNQFINLLRRVLDESNKNCKDKILLNLVGQGFLMNQNKKNKVKKEGSYSPTTILISPTMRCNLSCIGCYAGNYSKKDDMDYKLFDRIVTEAEEMGISFFTILGGEPLVYQDLFKIFKKHNNSYFQFFTNSTLINDSIVEKLIEVGNAIPMISIEGWEKQTDQRRGKGIYKKIIFAMKKLKKAGVPFGVSVAVTEKNTEIISSEKFIKFLIENGAFFCWWFLYMPIGKDPDTSLMPTPKQRKMLYEQRKTIRKKYPIFLIDFWNDAPYVGGCIAGKEYIHINSKGDVEPCIFTHFASDNIKNKTLKEVMASDYFKELRKRQPFNDNLYMPCMWIDNPKVSREIHKKYGVYPTHPGAEQIINDKKIKNKLDKYAQEIEKEYKQVWKKERSQFCRNCKGCNK